MLINSIRNIFYIYIMVYIIWPQYIALKVGSLPAISADRLVLLLLIIAIIFAVMHNKIKNAAFSRSLTLMPFFVIWGMWNIITSMIAAEDILHSLYSSVNWYLTGPIVFMITLYVLINKNRQENLVLIIVIAATIVNAIGLIEDVKGETLFNNLLFTKNEYTLNALIEKTRDDVFRIRSVYSNPLSYAHFLVTVMPLYIYCIGLYKHKLYKIFFAINVVATYYLLYKTGSRAGLMISLIMPIFSMVMSVFRITQVRILAYLAILTMSMLLLINALNYISDNIYSASYSHELNVSGVLDDRDLSNYARINQFRIGYKSFLNNPIFGVGHGEEHRAIAPMNAIDNYYLSIVLSTGIIGLAFFLVFIIATIKKGIACVKQRNDGMCIYLTISFIGICCFYVIVSIDQINVLLFVISALIHLRINRKHIYAGRL